MNTKSVWKLVLSIVAVVSGVLFIASQSTGDVQYYMHVDKVFASPEKWLDKPGIKVHGHVVPGSIKTEIRGQQTNRTFMLEHGGREIEVRHAGVAPDTFKDQAETVVTGKLLKEGDRYVVKATDGDGGIMAKCPSKYSGQR